jgi:hypothetical protein
VCVCVCVCVLSKVEIKEVYAARKYRHSN